jgi:hypothetical protein
MRSWGLRFPFGEALAYLIYHRDRRAAVPQSAGQPLLSHFADNRLYRLDLAKGEAEARNRV